MPIYADAVVPTALTVQALQWPHSRRPSRRLVKLAYSSATGSTIRECRTATVAPAQGCSGCPGSRAPIVTESRTAAACGSFLDSFRRVRPRNRRTADSVCWGSCQRSSSSDRSIRAITAAIHASRASGVKGAGGRGSGRPGRRTNTPDSSAAAPPPTRLPG